MGAGEFGGVMDRVGGEGEGAPGGFGLGEPGHGGVQPGGMPAVGHEVGFLGVEAAFGVAALCAVDAEARGGVGGDHACAAGVADGVACGSVKFEQDVEGVFDGGAFAVAANAGGEALRRAEEGHGLIKQMGAEILEDAVGVAWGLFPAIGAGGGTEAVPLGEHGRDAAECAVGEYGFQGEEVAVPAAVMEGEEVLAGVAGRADEVRGRGAGGRHGFIDHDMFAGGQGGLGEGGMGLIRGRDDDEIEGRVGKGLFGGAKNTDVRVGFGGIVPGALSSLDDRGEFEAGDCADEGAVEDAAGEAEAEDGDADRFTHTASIVRRVRSPVARMS